MSKLIRSGHPRGSILVLTLVALVVLASLAITLSGIARVEASATTNQAARIQADGVAKGAIEYVRSVITGTNGTLPLDSALNTQAVPVGTGYFWILKHDPDNDTTWNFGLTDEAGKVNINYATSDQTALLPNMNPDLAAGIYDWRTTGEAPSAGGAKSSYYLALPTPYNCKDSAFETVDELLMVKDITPAILYGNDTNRNGIQDPTDTDPLAASSGLSSSSSVTLGGIQHGLADYVTVYSTEPSTDSTGQTRVNVNGAAAGAGGTGGGATAGGTGGNANSNLLTVLTTYLSGSRVGPVLAATIVGRPFRNVLDYYYRTGLTQDEFNLLADHLTTGGTPRGLININTASQAVLTSLPGLSAADVASIYALRQNGTGATSIAAVAAILPRAKGTSIGGMITVRSYRCSADIVAVDGTGRSFKRYQVVFDTIATPAKVLYIRDITSLGWPLDPSILTQLRAGQSVTGTVTSSSSMGGAH